MDQSKVSSKVEGMSTKGGEKEEEVANMGRNKRGMMDLGGGQVNTG